ncbi:hypothetical protein GQ55_7G190500 [Panicum hallii var. hallii]|uniref:Uncharacterized protein n=1 Tax=Panicum hallii var. hallii TaxID=1504633 RepID=A0A2T7CWM2_9POAL|nr:hypothetical protein GQ55_7G190500 [Panicum hallii var. hallii]
MPNRVQPRHGVAHALRDDAHAPVVGERDDDGGRWRGASYHDHTSSTPHPVGEGIVGGLGTKIYPIRFHSRVSRQSQGAGDWLHFYLFLDYTRPRVAVVWAGRFRHLRPHGSWRVTDFSSNHLAILIGGARGTGVQQHDACHEQPRADGQRRRASQLLREHATPPEGRGTSAGMRGRSRFGCSELKRSVLAVELERWCSLLPATWMSGFVSLCALLYSY